MNQKLLKSGYWFTRTTLSLFLFNALMASQSTVLADCQPDSSTDPFPPEDMLDWSPQPGGSVGCTGYDADGFYRDGDDWPIGMDNITITVANGATVAGGYLTGGLQLINSDGSSMTNNGTVLSVMRIRGNNGTIVNAESGTVETIDMEGDNHVLLNEGTVTGNVVVDGVNASATNTGTVTGDFRTLKQGGNVINSMDGTAGALAADGDNSEIKNHGNVTVGIVASGSNMTIFNDGDITTSLGIGRAIELVGSGSIQNDGVITATADNGQAGIVAVITGSSSAENTGSITSTSYGIGIDAVSFAPAGTTATITNSGNVTTSGFQGIGLGLLGSGTIVNTGSIITNGEDSEGIGAVGNDVDITNGNIIHTYNITSPGIDREGDEGVTRNDGSIQTGLGGSPGIYIVGNTTSDNPNVINNGTIMTDGYLSPGIAVDGAGHYIQTLEGSSITTTEDDAEGIWANYADKIENAGQITVQGFLSDGIEVNGPEVIIENKQTGIITVSGSGATGITANGGYAEITNQGTITTVDNALWGIYVAGNSATVENDSGSITTVSGGIYISGDDATARNLFTSSGSFISTNGTEAHGMEVSGSNAIVDNYANIDTVGMDSHGIKVTGDGSKVHNHAGGIITTQTGSGLLVEGTPQYVTNDGQLITGLGAASDSDGIRVETAGLGGIDIDNNGIIESYGNDSDGISAKAASSTMIDNASFITTQGDYANGIELLGVAGHTVTNSGQLTTTGSEAHGIAMFRTSAGGSSLIINSGTVTSAGPGSSAIHLATQSDDTTIIVNNESSTITGSGYAIEGGAGEEVVRNFGTINGDVELDDGNDIYRRASNSIVNGIVYGGAHAELDRLDINFDGEETFDGEKFIDFELLIVEGTGSIKMISDHTTELTGIASGTLTIDEAVTLFSGSTTVLTGGRLNGNGTVSGDVTADGGVVDIGESIGALGIGGDLLFSGGKLSLEADSTSSLDQLSVGGNVTLDNAILEIFLGYTPGEGEVLDFFDVGGVFNVASDFDDIVGIAQAGSGVALGTEFTVSLGGQLFGGTVTSVVPVPASIWLFGSGLLGLVGVARRKSS